MVIINTITGFTMRSISVAVDSMEVREDSVEEAVVDIIVVEVTDTRIGKK